MRLAEWRADHRTITDDHAQADHNRALSYPDNRQRDAGDALAGKPSNAPGTLLEQRFHDREQLAWGDQPGRVIGDRVDPAVPITIPSDQTHARPAEQGNRSVAHFGELHQQRGHQSENEPVTQRNQEIEVDERNPFDQVGIRDAERIRHERAGRDCQYRPMDTKFSGMSVEWMTV
jgi:hypothetical protein